MDQIRVVGDRYPPLTIQSEGLPQDLRGMRVTYDFLPDSKRNKSQRSVDLRVTDPVRGVVEAPRPRSPGVCAITVHFPNGERDTLFERIRVIRRLPDQP